VRRASARVFRPPMASSQRPDLDAFLSHAGAPHSAEDYADILAELLMVDIACR